jgi:hypothetical protein
MVNSAIPCAEVVTVNDIFDRPRTRTTKYDSTYSSIGTVESGRPSRHGQQDHHITAEKGLAAVSGRTWASRS